MAQDEDQLDGQEQLDEDGMDEDDIEGSMLDENAQLQQVEGQ